MPYDSMTDTTLVLRVNTDLDGVTRLTYDGSQLAVVSSTTLSAADKHIVAAAALSFITSSAVTVLINGSDNGSGSPVSATVADLAAAS